MTRAVTHYFGDGCEPAHECPCDHTKNPLKADICGTCGADLDRWWEDSDDH